MWNLSSRVHALNHFPDDGVDCYVKRDDELGCGISGSKLRKYASLIPFFLHQEIKHLIIIAGPQSNNLLAALQVAREFKLDVTAFLIKPWKMEVQGNFKLSRLFLQEDEIVWVARENWPSVVADAQHYLDNLHTKGYLLDEGASVPEAMHGAMTIAEDILLNEHSIQGSFQHIFVDAGTGFSAVALIGGLAKLGHQACIYVLLLADEIAQFKAKLHAWLGFDPDNYVCFYPTTAKAFGSTNQTIKQEIKRLAREEGILADPVYAAKLFYESRKFIEINKLKGKALLIHSGGTLTMPNFNYTP